MPSPRFQPSRKAPALAPLLVAAFLLVLLVASRGEWGAGRTPSPETGRIGDRPPVATPETATAEPVLIEPGPPAVSEPEPADSLEEPEAEPVDPRAAISDYRETFNRAGAPLAQAVDRLQQSPPPVPLSACRDLVRRLDSFAAVALPAPFEPLTFSLTNALARYREAARACEIGELSAMRHRLQMGTMLWKRSTAEMRAVLAGDSDVFESRPESVAEAFADLPTGSMSSSEWSPERRSGSSGFDPGGDNGRRPCCKVCDKGQPCGDSCISWRYTCRQPPGCAC